MTTLIQHFREVQDSNKYLFQVNLLVDIVILIPFICRKFNQYGIDKVKRSCLEISKLVHLGGDALTMTIHCQDITCLSAYW
jgi:hypothetical protein